MTPKELQAAIAEWPIDTLLEKHECFLRWGTLLSPKFGPN